MKPKLNYVNIETEYDHQHGRTKCFLVAFLEPDGSEAPVSIRVKLGSIELGTEIDGMMLELLEKSVNSHVKMVDCIRKFIAAAEFSNLPRSLVNQAKIIIRDAHGKAYDFGTPIEPDHPHL